MTINTLPNDLSKGLHQPDAQWWAGRMASPLTDGADVRFTISVEPPDLVRMEMGGFFSEDDIRAFRQVLDLKLRALRCPPNAHLSLVDVRAMKIQRQEIVAAFAGLVGHPEVRSKRLAFVTGSSLARMQTRRLTDRPGVAFFTDIAQAEAWLKSAD